MSYPVGPGWRAGLRTSRLKVYASQVGWAMVSVLTLSGHCLTWVKKERGSGVRALVWAGL